MFIVRILAILIVSTSLCLSEAQGAIWPANYSNVKHDETGSKKNMEQEEHINKSRGAELTTQGTPSPESASSGSAGSGFSDMLGKAKSGLSELKKKIGDAISSVVKFFTGDGKPDCEGLDTPSGASACFYVDDTNLNLSSSEIKRTKANIAAAMSISAKELLSDSTTVINSSGKYDKEKENIEDEASSSENITAALQNRTEGELAFINMAATLLSMDIKRLEIESLASFQAINKAKQPLGGGAGGGVSSLVGGAIGGLF